MQANCISLSPVLHCSKWDQVPGSQLVVQTVVYRRARELVGLAGDQKPDFGGDR